MSGQTSDGPSTLRVRRSQARSQNCPLAQVVVCRAPRPIPLDLFTGHPDRLPGPLATAAADPLAFTDTVAVIVDYSLAKRTEAGLQLHRLVQAAIRGRHTRQAAAGTTQAT